MPTARGNARDGATRPGARARPRYTISGSATSSGLRNALECCRNTPSVLVCFDHRKARLRASDPHSNDGVRHRSKGIASAPACDRDTPNAEVLAAMKASGIEAARPQDEPAVSGVERAQCRRSWQVLIPGFRFGGAVGVSGFDAAPPSTRRESIGPSRCAAPIAAIKASSRPDWPCAICRARARQESGDLPVAFCSHARAVRRTRWR